MRREYLTDGYPTGNPTDRRVERDPADPRRVLETPMREDPGARARQILEEENTILGAIETARERGGGPQVFIPRGVLNEQAGQIVRDDSSIGGGWVPIDALSSSRSLSSLGRQNEVERQ